MMEMEKKFIYPAFLFYHPHLINLVNYLKYKLLQNFQSLNKKSVH
jgi:hypothetical protein